MVHSFPKGTFPLVSPLRGNIPLAGVHFRALLAPVTVLLHGAKNWQLVREVVECGAPAKAQARPRQPGPPTADGAVEALGKGSPHLGRWLMLKSRALKHTRGLRAGRRAVGRTVTQRPDAPPPDDGGP